MVKAKKTKGKLLKYTRLIDVAKKTASCTNALRTCPFNSARLLG